MYAGTEGLKQQRILLLAEFYSLLADKAFDHPSDSELGLRWLAFCEVWECDACGVNLDGSVSPANRSKYVPRVAQQV